MRRSIGIVTDNIYPVLDGSSLRVSRLVQAIRSEARDYDMWLIAAVQSEHAAQFLEWCDQHRLTVSVHLYNGNLFEPANRARFASWVRPEVERIREQVQGFIVFGGIAIDVCSEAIGESVAIADVCDEKSPHALHAVASHLRNWRLHSAIRQTWWLYLYLKRIHRSLRPYRAVTVAAHDDAKRLHHLSRHPHILVVPNGVDVVSSCPDVLNGLGKKSAIFHGVLDYPPNWDAVVYLLRKICPLVYRLDPEVKFYVVGRNPGAQLYRYARLTRNAEIVGPVDDIWSWLCSAKLGVYPIRLRTGIQNKLLEAWAAGLPVVTSTQAMSVFRTSENQEVPAIVARSAADFARAIVSTLTDETRRAALGRSAKEFVARRFRWEKSAGSFLRLLGISPSDH